MRVELGKALRSLTSALMCSLSLRGMNQGPTKGAISLNCCQLKRTHSERWLSYSCSIVLVYYPENARTQCSSPFAFYYSYTKQFVTPSSFSSQPALLFTESFFFSLLTISQIWLRSSQQSCLYSAILQLISPIRSFSYSGTLSSGTKPFCRQMSRQADWLPLNCLASQLESIGLTMESLMQYQLFLRALSFGYFILCSLFSYSSFVGFDLEGAGSESSTTWTSASLKTSLQYMKQWPESAVPLWTRTETSSYSGCSRGAETKFCMLSQSWNQRQVLTLTLLKVQKQKSKRLRLTTKIGGTLDSLMPRRVSVAVPQFQQNTLFSFSMHQGLRRAARDYSTEFSPFTIMFRSQQVYGRSLVQLQERHVRYW